MLRAMLVDRFGMTYRIEKRKVPGYDLVLAKNGPPLTAAAGTSPPGDPSLPDTLPSAASIARDRQGFAIIPAGSPYSAVGGLGGRTTRRFDHTSMGQLTDLLSNIVRRPVRDATALMGEYAFTLRYVQDNNAMVNGLPVAPSDDDPAGPTIFAALQQIGLKLEPSEAEIEVLVIDRIQKNPTEN